MPMPVLHYRSKSSGGSLSVRFILSLSITLVMAMACLYIYLFTKHPENILVKSELNNLSQPINQPPLTTFPIISTQTEAPKIEINTENDSKAEDNVSRGEIDGSSKKKKRVAVAITVTKDGHFVDGALVLGYAAKKFHSPAKGYPSDYEIDLVAFVAPKVVTSRPILEKYGWQIIERGLPVALDEIENQDYAQRMRDSGCCGADEFLKLWAYTLTEYHRVIHLDMDSIIFRNLDQLFAIDKELLYTGDYNMGSKPFPPAQGGFLVIRPSMKAFDEFRAIIKKGDHRPGSGWGGSHIGNFWGGQTIQGIMPYFYNILHAGEGQEMNRCQYNNMVDNPYHKNTQICINGQPTCEDCRLSDPDAVYSAHFTICQKPWTCTKHDNPRNMVVCLAFHKKWFQLRDEMERDLQLDLSYRVQGNLKFPESLGMCRGYGDNKYLPIPIPT